MSSVGLTAKTLKDNNWAGMVVRQEINYHKEVFELELLYIESSILEIGNRSFILHHKMKNGETVEDNVVSLIAKIGEKITIGKASFENPAEAMIYDSFNQKHYLMVAPESAQEVFIEGSEVVLLEKLENYWLATALTN